MKYQPLCARAGVHVCVSLMLVSCMAGCKTPPVSAPEVLHREPLLSQPAIPVQAVAGVTPPVAVETVTADRVAGISEVSAGAEATLPSPVVSVQTLPTQIITNLELADVVDIVTLLRMMAKLANVNMLISPKVEGNIGFTFRGVPWDQAFKSIISSAGLTYVWQDDVLRVMTIDDVKRELEMETLLKDRETVRDEMRRVEPMVLRVIPIHYLVAETVGLTVQRMLLGTPAVVQGVQGVDGTTGRQKPTISTDGESNSLIVHAVQADVDKVAGLVAQLDRPSPLVQIEARIVEATRDTARQLGMQWGGQSARLSGGRLVSGNSASTFPALYAQTVAPPVGFTLGVASDKLGANELLNLQLTALQQQGRIQINASPSVTTLDHETAVIESGEERAYRVSTGTGNVLDVSLEWKKAVLKLEVTPHVVDGRKLRVEIVAHKDSFDETKPQTNNEFPVNTKHAQTTVMLLDGETTMIGGFSLESNSDSTTGVPFLMHIPVLGALFRSKSSSDRFDETIIFITPTIL